MSNGSKASPSRRLWILSNTDNTSLTRRLVSSSLLASQRQVEATSCEQG